MSSPALLFVNQRHAPDLTFAGRHLTDLLAGLAGEGFDVDVGTPPAAAGPVPRRLCPANAPPSLTEP